MTREETEISSLNVEYQEYPSHNLSPELYILGSYTPPTLPNLEKGIS